MLLLKKPKVRSYVLSEAYFDAPNPLLLRFKLDSGICPDFLEVFLDHSGGTALLGQHYNIKASDRVKVNIDSNNNLKSLSLLIPGDSVYADLAIYPVVNITELHDHTLSFKIVVGDRYRVAVADIDLTINASRAVLLRGGFGFRGLNYAPRLGVSFNCPDNFNVNNHVEFSPENAFQTGTFLDYGISFDPDIQLVGLSPENAFQTGTFLDYGISSDPDIQLVELDADWMVLSGLLGPDPLFDDETFIE